MSLQIALSIKVKQQQERERELQIGFMPGRGAIDAIFIASEMQKKYFGKKKNLYFVFVGLEKAFDRVPGGAVRL